LASVGQPRLFAFSDVVLSAHWQPRRWKRLELTSPSSAVAGTLGRSRRRRQVEAERTFAFRNPGGIARENSAIALNARIFAGHSAAKQRIGAPDNIVSLFISSSCDNLYNNHQ
jgi:hypothetical protein